MTAATAARRPAVDDRPAGGRARRTAAKALLGIPTLAVTAFGGQLLVTGWADRTPGGGHQVQDLAWGAMEGILLLAGLVVLFHRPQRRPAAALQVIAVVAALGAVMLLTATPDPFTLVLGTLAVSGTLLAAGPPRLSGIHIHLPTAALAAIAAACLIPYAVYSAAAQRTSDDRHAELLGYTGAAVWALALVAVAAVASFQQPGARVSALSAVAAAAVVGVASVLWPDVPSSLGMLGGTLTLTWALALGFATLRRVT